VTMATLPLQRSRELSDILVIFSNQPVLIN
jgi:hypothetical protein